MRYVWEGGLNDKKLSFNFVIAKGEGHTSVKDMCSGPDADRRVSFNGDCGRIEVNGSWRMNFTAWI